MQYKSLINPSFLVICLDLQEHCKAGWEIDPNNLPVNNFLFNEIHLIKDDEDVVSEVFQEGRPQDVVSTPPAFMIPKKQAGRPPRNKEAH